MFRLGILLLLALPSALIPSVVYCEEVSKAKQSFDWPSPKTVKISELALKKGNTAELTYEIDFQRGKGRDYLVSLKNLTFKKLNGSAVTPEIERGLQPAINAFNTMPTFVVNETGRLADIEGIERLVSATGNALAVDDKTLDALKSKQATALLKHALSQYWTCWVEAWIDFDLPPGSEVERMFDQPLPGAEGGKPIRGVRKWEHLGPVEGRSGLVHLRMEETFKDESLTKAITELIHNFDQANQVESSEDSEDMPVVLATSSMEVQIDLMTLRPIWAKRTKHIQVNSDDPQFAKFEQKESHEYSFTWN